MLNRYLRRALVLLVAALSALAVPACGGGEEEDPQALLKKAFTTDVETTNVTLNAEFSGKGVPQLEEPVRVKVSGPYKSNGNKKLPSLDWDLSVSGGGQSFSAGAISTGDNVFINFNDTPYEVGEDAIRQQNEQLARQQQDDNALKALGIDPATWVKDPKTEGDEEVAGADTTHVTGTVDVAKMVTDLSGVAEKTGAGAASKPSDEELKQVADAVKDPTLDVYVDKETDALRRLSVDLAFEVPENERQSAGGLESGNFSFSLDLADAADVEIAAPKGAKPISELVGQLGSLGALGGLGSGGTEGGTAPATPGSPTTPPDTGASPGKAGDGAGPDTGGTPGGAGGPQQEKFERYAQCISEADPNDAAAIESCSRLLQ